MKLLFLLVVLPSVYAPTVLLGQTTSSATHNSSCKINTVPPTDADIAFYNGDSQKATTLYADAVARDPSNEIARVRQIQALLDLQKNTEAAQLADAWTAKSNDAFAVLASGSVRLDEGDLVEGYALLAKAAALDPCLADVYQSMARFEELAGYHDTSRKHLALAHQLDPLNDRIRLNWIDSLAPSDQIEELEKYLTDSKLLDDKRRAYFSAVIERKRAITKANCHMVSKAHAVTIPMRIFPNVNGIDYYGLEIEFNGTSRLLWIDSTRSGLNLYADSSAGLNLTTLDKPHPGLVGVQQRYLNDEIKKAASVKIGGIEFADCPVQVPASLNSSGRMQVSQDSDLFGGLIGTDIFDRYLITLDYVRHEVRLEPLPRSPSETIPAEHLDAMGGDLGSIASANDRYVAPAMQNWTKIYRKNQHLLMPVRIGSPGIKLFRLDTYDLFSAISPQTATEVTSLKRDGAGYLSPDSVPDDFDSDSKGMKAFKTGSLTLDFANMRLPFHSMVALDTSYISKDVGVTISGFLGYPELSKLVMHLDYRDNLVLFEAPPASK
jgi:hypothetical protein